MYGRHGESPLPIVAAKTPSHCFEATIEAVRLAVKYRTPVILLSDGYLANGTEPWRLPDLDELPAIDPGFATATNHTEPDGNEVFWPYVRDEETLARPWAPPGLAGLEHRIGGLEKADGSGNVAYDGPNHERMTRLRAAKIAGIAHDIPPTDVDDHDGADVLVIGWGSTYGAIAAGVQRVRARGHKVAHAHLVHLNPFPADLGDVLAPLPKVLVPEVNLGQLSRLLRAEYLVDAISFTQVQGIPFRAAAMESAILQQIDGTAESHATRGGLGRHHREGVPLMTDLAARPTTMPPRGVGACPAHHPQGLVLGSGGPVVPRVRGLLDPRRRTDAHARPRGAPGATVFLSGIGCAARFPYYMNTYGMHSIHGRAPAIATGLATTRPDLDVWVVTGDGDSLSIGGNHLIHALRRNVDITILLFNNQIYGLTKGQYSPTSEVAKVTKSTPFGSLEQPFNPLSLALGAEARFVARTHDMDRKHMMETFRRAHAHKGASFVEIYQNCNVFNDGAFEQITGKEHRADMLIPLVHGEPIRFGAEGEHGVVLHGDGSVEVVEVAEVGEAALLVHDEHRDNPGLAFQLSRLSRGPYEPTPIGVFRDVDRPEYGDGDGPPDR